MEGYRNVEFNRITLWNPIGPNGTGSNAEMISDNDERRECGPLSLLDETGQPNRNLNHAVKLNPDGPDDDDSNLSYPVLEAFQAGPLAKRMRIMLMHLAQLDDPEDDEAVIAHRGLWRNMALDFSDEIRREDHLRDVVFEAIDEAVDGFAAVRSEYKDRVKTALYDIMMDIIPSHKTAYRTVVDVLREESREKDKPFEKQPLTFSDAYRLAQHLLDQVHVDVTTELHETYLPTYPERYGKMKENYPDYLRLVGAQMVLEDALKMSFKAEATLSVKRKKRPMQDFQAEAKVLLEKAYARVSRELEQMVEAAMA
jgi:hypothetical protein